jgi:hypothetical protein
VGFPSVLPLANHSADPVNGSLAPEETEEEAHDYEKRDQDYSESGQAHAGKSSHKDDGQTSAQQRAASAVNDAFDEPVQR